MAVGQLHQHENVILVSPANHVIPQHLQQRIHLQKFDDGKIIQSLCTRDIGGPAVEAPENVGEVVFLDGLAQTQFPPPHPRQKAQGLRLRRTLLPPRRTQLLSSHKIGRQGSRLPRRVSQQPAGVRSAAVVVRTASGSPQEGHCSRDSRARQQRGDRRIGGGVCGVAGTPDRADLLRICGAPRVPERAAARGRTRAQG
ncbi:unnamed protein product [Sphagnum balticum]